MYHSLCFSVPSPPKTATLRVANSFRQHTWFQTALNCRTQGPLGGHHHGTALITCPPPAADDEESEEEADNEESLLVRLGEDDRGSVGSEDTTDGDSDTEFAIANVAVTAGSARDNCEISHYRELGFRPCLHKTGMCHVAPKAVVPLHICIPPRYRKMPQYQVFCMGCGGRTKQAFNAALFGTCRVSPSI